MEPYDRDARSLNSSGVRTPAREGTLEAMRPPRLQSTFARAVVPVAGGIGFFALLALALWGVAAVISRNGDQTSANLAPDTYEMGNAEMIAEVIVDDGPIVLQDLVGDEGSIVLTWTDDAGFAIHLAHPADRDVTCTIVVVPTTSTFEDCDGRTLTADDLALPPRGWHPRSVRPEF